jgi:hypothetical protein
LLNFCRQEETPTVDAFDLFSLSVRIRFGFVHWPLLETSHKSVNTIQYSIKMRIDIAAFAFLTTLVVKTNGFGIHSMAMVRGGSSR